MLWVRKWAGLLDVKMADGLAAVMEQRMVALSVAYSVAEMAEKRVGLSVAVRVDPLVACLVALWGATKAVGSAGLSALCWAVRWAEKTAAVMAGLRVVATAAS